MVGKARKGIDTVGRPVVQFILVVLVITTMHVS